MKPSSPAKRVVLLRHGKSDWTDPGIPDFDRPLSDRGRKDSARAGCVLARMRAVPDLIISSPAARALHTARIVAERLAGRVDAEKILRDTSLYDGDCPDLLRALAGLPETVALPLVVGHNPFLERFAASVVSPAVRGGVGFDAEPPHTVRLPTGGMACIEFQAFRWAEVTEVPALILWLVTPKLVKALGCKSSGRTRGEK